MELVKERGKKGFSLTTFHRKKNNNNNDDKKSLARIWPEFKVIIYYPARHAQQSVRWRAWMDWSAERWTEGETHASTTFHECLRNWCCYKFRLSVSFYTKYTQRAAAICSNGLKFDCNWETQINFAWKQAVTHHSSQLTESLPVVC